MTDNSLNGGDTFDVHNTGDTVVESHDVHDTALINSTVSYSLIGTGVQQLTLSPLGTANLTATADITGNDTLNGNNGNDIFNDSGVTGSGNADTMVGNSTVVGGGDTFFVNNTADSITETGLSSTTALISSNVSFSLLGTGVHQLTLTGAKQPAASAVRKAETRSSAISAQAATS